MLELAAIEALLASETFRQLPHEDLVALAGISSERTYEPGQTIFREGDVAEALLLLLKGRVALEKAIVLGRRGARQATVEVIQPGQIFGWSAAIAPYELTATAVCVERSRVLAIDAEALRKLADERPSLGYHVVSRLASIAGARLRDTTHRLSYLLTIASHDLKAPLAAVESYLQVMLGGFTGPLADKQKQMLTRCSERITEALDLVSNFLDISRLEAGQMYDELEVISIARVAHRALDIIHPVAADKGVLLDASIPEDLPSIQGSALRLQQVLVNLLGNAVKFTPSGGWVHLSLAEEGECIRIEVVDTGIGIAPEDLPHIFDDFFRGSGAESVGAGLGLAIARRIVAGHGGRIWAESPLQPDAAHKGTRVVVMLPKQARPKQPC